MTYEAVYLLAINLTTIQTVAVPIDDSQDFVAVRLALSRGGDSGASLVPSIDELQIVANASLSLGRSSLDDTQSLRFEKRSKKPKAAKKEKEKGKNKGKDSNKHNNTNSNSNNNNDEDDKGGLSFEYWMLSPSLGNCGGYQWFALGELDTKFVPLSVDRFARVELVHEPSCAIVWRLQARFAASNTEELVLYAAARRLAANGTASNLRTIVKRVSANEAAIDGWRMELEGVVV